MKKAVKEALIDIAVEYLIDTELEHDRTDIALNKAYLKASRYGVSGIEVRKAIAETAQRPDIERRLKQLKESKWANNDKHKTKDSRKLIKLYRVARGRKLNVKKQCSFIIGFVSGFISLCVGVYNKRRGERSGSRKNNK